MRVVGLRCQHCSMPAAFVYNGVVTVDSKHNGHTHSNSISRKRLIDLLRLSQGGISLSDLVQAMTITGHTYDTGVVGDQPAIILRCYRPDCNAPWGYIVDGNLYVTSWHDREKHQNIYSTDVLRTICSAT